MTTVSRKPIAVCVVSAVPMKRVSVVSVREAEKTPESAITAAPHTTRKATRTAVGAAKKIGDAMQHAPLITSAVTAAGERPNRSDAQPPMRQPAVPATPMVTNTMTPVDRPETSPRWALPATTNVDNQVHMAYSSHMCPK